MKINITLSDKEIALITWLTAPFRLLHIIAYGLCAGFWLTGEWMQKVWLRRQARHHYMAYSQLRDQYGCGLHLAAHITPELRYHASAFNAAMDKLSKLDPATPAGRLVVL